MYSANPPWRTAGSVTTVTNTNSFIPVTARRTFGHPPAPGTYQQQPFPTQPPPPPPSATITAAAAPAPARKKEWSPAVRQYVQRCFAPESEIKGITRAELESKLKQVITQAAADDSLDVIDWANFPLPQQMIQDERNRQILAPPPQLKSWPPPTVLHVPQESISLSSPDSSLRKRKSSELTTDADEEPRRPPWSNGATSNVLADRVSFPPLSDKRQRSDHNERNQSKSNKDLQTRKKRFEDGRSGYASPLNGNSSRGDSPAVIEDVGPVVGRSDKLEKNYFRLTSAPNPDTVRPLEVLKKTLELLKNRWREESNYAYICDQFKSLRQDLTVQHIKNAFTVNVYEIHARIALEKGDLGEYNQCQTQLRALYKQNLGGRPVEFKAYRILYFIHTCNRTDMNDVLSELTPADKAEPAIKHALEVRSALALGNYHRFFQLYLETPNMGAYLMDMFVGRERLSALASICKVYKPDVRIRFVSEELGFESDGDCATFILEYASQDILQEKEDGVRFLTGKAGQIFENAKAGAFKQIDIKGQI